MSLDTQTKLAIYRHFAETGQRPSLQVVAERVRGALGVARGLGYWSVLGIALALTAVALACGHRIEHFAERLVKPKRSKSTDPSV